MIPSTTQVAASTLTPGVSRDHQPAVGESATAGQPFPVYDEWADDVIDGAPLGFKILMCAWAVAAVIGIALVLA